MALFSSATMAFHSPRLKENTYVVHFLRQKRIRERGSVFSVLRLVSENKMLTFCHPTALTDISILH